jgi:hypothetical protein
METKAGAPSGAGGAGGATSLGVLNGRLADNGEALAPFEADHAYAEARAEFRELARATLETRIGELVNALDGDLALALAGIEEDYGEPVRDKARELYDRYAGRADSLEAQAALWQFVCDLAGRVHPGQGVHS